ncbi:YdcH family protein [Lacimonas salitolerans]|uniref:YdcH family protein n=1 Tax=Lacimonas salitolerans TaxID=1323750 RepID=A0ABW4EIR1_9RHOB
MKVSVLERVASVSARVAALQTRKQTLEDEIAAEEKRPMPDAARLRHLKARKLRIRDQLARYDGVLRTLKPLAGHVAAHRGGVV